jgi:hypothetical protein
MSLRTVSECQHVIVNSAAGGTLAIVAAVAGQGVNVYRMILTTATTVTVTLQDTSGNALSQPFAFGANGGAVTIDDPMNGDPWWSSVTGRGIQFNASTNVQVSADVWFIQGVVAGLHS